MPGLAQFKWKDQARNDGRIEKHFEKSTHLDKSEIRAAVIEHHDFVDHGQFQVCGRIVHRHTGIFREQDNEKRR
jgi:hypothetical protein